jgi:hypothetical protein
MKVRGWSSEFCADGKSLAVRCCCAIHGLYDHMRSIFSSFTEFEWLSQYAPLASSSRNSTILDSLLGTKFPFIIYTLTTPLREPRILSIPLQILIPYPILLHPRNQWSQRHAIISRIGRAHQRMHMEFRRLCIIQKHAAVVVELHDYHGRLDPEVECAVGREGADPAEIGGGEMRAALF